MNFSRLCATELQKRFEEFVLKYKLLGGFIVIKSLYKACKETCCCKFVERIKIRILKTRSNLQIEVLTLHKYFNLFDTLNYALREWYGTDKKNWENIPLSHLYFFIHGYQQCFIKLILEFKMQQM